MTDDNKNIIPEGNGLQDETPNRSPDETPNGTQPDGIGAGQIPEEIPAADTSGTGSETNDAAQDAGTDTSGTGSETNDAAQDAGTDRNAWQIEQDETRQAIIAAAASLAGMSPGEEIDGKTAARFFRESTPESRAAWMRQAPEAGKRLKEAAENVRAMVLYELTNPDKERAAAVVDAAMNIMLIYSREMSGRLALALTPEFSGMADFLFSEDGEEAHRAARAATVAAVVWAEVRNEVPELTPYIEAEARSGYGLELDALLDTAEIGPDGALLPNCVFMMALTAARAARAAEEESIERVTAKRIDVVDWPLDRYNNTIWSLSEEETAGRVKIEMASKKDREKGISLPAYYEIDFEELEGVEISKPLTAFDKRVYMALASLAAAGNKFVSARQIFLAIGGTTGEPDKAQKKRIYDSIEKMSRANVKIKNIIEPSRYKGFGPTDYKGPLLPVGWILTTINGQRTNAIRLIEPPILVRFARERKQITTVPVKLLQSPPSKTVDNLAIENYLILRITKEKHNKQKHCRILYETLYKHTNRENRSQQKRARDRVDEYLTFYKKEKFIKGFSKDRDGVTIFLP